MHFLCDVLSSLFASGKLHCLFYSNTITDHVFHRLVGFFLAILVYFSDLTYILSDLHA